MLRRCLMSMKKFDPLMLVHTLVVEEFASSGVQWVCDFGCEYIHKHKAPGYASSINIGLGFARSKSYTHVVTINSDIEFTQSILVPFMRGFRYGEIVGGTLWYPSGKIQSAGWDYHDDCIPREFEKNLAFNTAEKFKEERYVGGITGALQGFSLECGDYDEGYYLSYEDVDFCVTNLLQGKRIFYTPSISAVHVESATRGYFTGPGELKSLKKYLERTKEITGNTLNSIVDAYNKTHGTVAKEETRS